MHIRSFTNLPLPLFHNTRGLFSLRLREFSVRKYGMEVVLQRQEITYIKLQGLTAEQKYLLRQTDIIESF